MIGFGVSFWLAFWELCRLSWPWIAITLSAVILSLV